VITGAGSREMAQSALYGRLDVGRIVATAEALAIRVSERFPDAGLSRVAREPARVAARADGRVAALRAPRRGLRIAIGATVAVNEVDALTTGLSAKIWQKLVILGAAVRPPQTAIR